MKATLTIDDEIFSRAGQLAKARSVSLDSVVSDFLKSWVSSAPPSRNQFPTFDVPAGTPPITPEDVRRADEDF